MLRKFYAKDGYVWKRKNSDWVGSNIIILGINDSIDNYEEIPYVEPTQEQE